MGRGGDEGPAQDALRRAERYPNGADRTADGPQGLWRLAVRRPEKPGDLGGVQARKRAAARDPARRTGPRDAEGAGCPGAVGRSDERRVGKAGVSTGRTRGGPT